MEKVKSKRDDSFKKKTSTVDKRSLRAHRRSIEWKQLRDQTVNQNRPNMGELSPLQEIHQNIEANKKVESRKEMLLRWKAEKELKKKLEAQEKAKHKPFKVAKCLPVDKKTFKKTTQSTGTLSTRPAVATQRANPASAIHSKVKSTGTNSNKQVAGVRITRNGTASKPVAATTTTKSSAGIAKKTADNVPQVSSRTRSTRSTTGTAKTVAASKDTKLISGTAKGKANTAKVPANDAKSRKFTTSKQTSSKPAVSNTKRESTRQVNGDAKKKAGSFKSKSGQSKDATEKDNAPEPEPINPLMVTPKSILKPAKSYMDSVNTKRGGRFGSDSEHSENEKSFAPNNFEFTAPANLKKYSPQFKPLSPGSAARFFMSNEVASPPNDPRRCSTPKFPVTKNPVLHTPQASIIRSTNSASSGSDSDAQNKASKDKKTTSVSTEAPVLSLNQQLENDEDLKTPKRNRRSTRGSQDTTENQVQNTTQPFTVKSVSFDVEKKENGEEGDEKDHSKEKQMETNQDDKETVGKQKSPENMQVVPQEPTKSPINKSTQSLPEELIASTCNRDKENVESVPRDAFNVFKTPDPVSGRGRRTRTRSLGLALSDKKRKTPRNNRTSLILRHLSPEEGVEVLRHSPMVELTRRTPKAHKPNAINLEPISLPNFDDLDDDVMMESSAPKNDNDVMLGSSVAKTDDKPQDGNSHEDVAMEEEKNSLGKDEKKSEENQALLVEKTTSLPAANATNSASENHLNEHDVPYFRQLLVDETKKLDELCNSWEALQSGNQDLPEEVCGQIRTARGKAQLLIAQRFKQFAGLVDACEFKTGEKETTCQDLQGFWDMIYFQVEDVQALFDELKDLERKNWQTDQPAVKAISKPATKKKMPAKKKLKGSSKSNFAAFRAQLKKQTSQIETVDEDSKTFEGGFFKVESPVKSPALHCDALHNSPNLATKNSVVTSSSSPLLKAVVKRSARLSGVSPLSKENETDDCALTTAEVSTPSRSTPRRSTRSNENITTSQVTRSDYVFENAVEQNATENTSETEKHDVPYFRQLLVTETEKLQSLCDHWQKQNTPELQENASGHIRTSIGKAQLLIAQRFKQFSGLVDACEFKTGEKETTCQDLQGFWDMIYFQVEDVHSLFEKLAQLQENNWIEKSDEEPSRKVIKNKPITKKSTATTKKPAGAKSKFAAFRANLQKQKQQEKIFDEKQESDKEVVKTFEAGFFQVTSPVRSPAVSRLCKDGNESDSASKKTSLSPGLRKSLLIQNARRSHGSSHLTASPRSGSKRKANNSESNSSTEGDAVPHKLHILESETNSEERITCTPTRASRGRRRSTRTPATVSSATKKQPCDFIHLLVASTQENTPADKDSELEVKASDSLFTPEHNTSTRRSTRRSIAASIASDTPATSSNLAKFLVPSAKSDEDDMDCDEMTSRLETVTSPTDVEMSARMKCDLLSKFNDHSRSASKRRKSSSATVIPGRSTPRRHSGLKSSELRSTRRPSTPFSKDLSKRRSIRSSIEMVNTHPALESSADDTASSANESPATRLAKLTVEGTPVDLQQNNVAPSRRQQNSRRISGFTPPQQITSPTRLTSVRENDDLMGFSPTPKEGTTNATPSKKLSRRRSTRRRVSGFTPPEVTSSPAARLPSVREVDDLIAFSPVASNENTTPRRSTRRSLRPNPL